MQFDSAGHLICPVCSAPLAKEGKSLICERRHTYDIAKAGYVNLHITSSQRQSGDSKEMAAARTAFLDTGAYAPFMEEIRSCAREYSELGVLVDAGCGEGYYTAALARDFGEVYGFDLSKASCAAAAKRARAEGVGERCHIGVASVYSMPIADGCADCAVNIFAPCAEEEYSRVLKEGGILIVACAGARHLEGLKGVLYEEIRENSERADLPSGMERLCVRHVSYSITLSSPEEIKNLYMMTPYCYRTAIESQEKLLALESLETLVDFDIHVYRK